MTDLSHETFGRRLQRLLYRIGWKQSRLAKELGESRQRVSNWVKNVSQPDLPMMSRISTVMAVPLPELLGMASHEDGDGPAFDIEDFSLSYRSLLDARTSLDASLEAMERQAARLGVVLQAETLGLGSPNPKARQTDAGVHRFLSTDREDRRRNGRKPDADAQ